MPVLCIKLLMHSVWIWRRMKEKTVDDDPQAQPARTKGPNVTLKSRKEKLSFARSWWSSAAAHHHYSASLLFRPSLSSHTIFLHTKKIFFNISTIKKEQSKSHKEMPKANDGFPVMKDIFQCCCWCGGAFAGNNIGLKPSNWFILHPKISEL
jgi:hypothetical protein